MQVEGRQGLPRRDHRLDVRHGREQAEEIVRAFDDDLAASRRHQGQVSGELHHVGVTLVEMDEDGAALQILALPGRLLERPALLAAQGAAPGVVLEAALQVTLLQQRQGPLPAAVDIVGPDRQGTLEAADGLVEMAQVAQHEAQVEDGDRRLRGQRDRLLMRRRRPVVAAEFAQRVTQVGMDAGVIRAERQRPLVTGDRCLQPAQPPHGNAEVVVSVRMAGRQGQGTAVAGDRGLELTPAMQARRFGEGAVDFLATGVGCAARDHGRGGLARRTAVRPVPRQYFAHDAPLSDRKSIVRARAAEFKPAGAARWQWPALAIPELFLLNQFPDRLTGWIEPIPAVGRERPCYPRRQSAAR